MIATICSSENRPFRIAPSESGASLSTYRWSENPRAGQVIEPKLHSGPAFQSRIAVMVPCRDEAIIANVVTIELGGRFGG
jgi:hypothetical protein